MKIRRKQVTIAMLMVAVVLTAAVVKVVEYSRRTRVVFANTSGRTIRDVSVARDGRVYHFGPVGPHEEITCRVSYQSDDPLVVAFDVQEDEGKPDRHLEAPKLTVLGPGSQVRIGYDGR